MPIYEYECPKCKSKVEEIKQMTDTSDVVCSKCKEIMKKIISGGVSVVYKGTGFYSTDYK